MAVFAGGGTFFGTPPTPLPEKSPVGIGLPLQRKRIGPGCRWHAPEGDGLTVIPGRPLFVIPDLIRNLYLDAATHRRNLAAKRLRNDLRGLLAGGDQGVAGGDLRQQGRDVGGPNHLQEGVGGVVTEAADFAGGVVEGQAVIGTKRPDGHLVKALFGRDAEAVFIVKEDEADDAPEVVDPVGVIEGHAPAVGLGREAAQE